MHNLHTIDMVIIGTYLFICLGLGFANMRGIKNIRDYTLGSRHISTPVLIATLFATHIGAGSTIGDIEQIYSIGLLFAVVTMLMPLLWITTGLVFARHIDHFRKAGCISLSDIMENLYGKPGRWITNIAAKFMAIAVTSMQILAIGYLLSYFTGITESQGAIIGFGVLVTYSLLGGIRAIVATDVLQGFVLAVGIPAACFAGYYDIGGYDGLVSKLPQTHLSINFTQDNILLLGSLILWASMPLSHGAFMQRFLMANDGKQLREAAKGLFFMCVPLACVIALTGFIVKAKVPEINANTAFFYLIDNYLPIGVKGLVISGILAAIMSTADSWLNTASVLWAHDIVKKVCPWISDKQELLVARISLVLIAGLASFLAFFKNESVMAMDWLACSFWEPVMFVPLTAGFLRLKTTSKSFVGSTTLGVLFTLAQAYTGAIGSKDFLLFDTKSMACGILGSLIGLFSVHYYYKPRAEMAKTVTTRAWLKA